MKQTPRLLIDLFLNGRYIHMGKYFLKEGETHEGAVKEIMNNKNMKNFRCSKSHIDMTGAMVVNIY